MENAVNLFSDRFEADGADFVYFHGAGHEGIPVTAQERDELIARYRRDMKRMIWASATLLILAISGMSLFADDGPDENPLFFWGITGVMGLMIGVGALYIGKAPLRVLERRTPTKRAKTKEEVKRDYFMRQSWSTVVGLPLFFGLFVGIRAYSAETEMEQLLWGALSVLMFAAAGVGAWRKRRYGATDRI